MKIISVFWVIFLGGNVVAQDNFVMRAFDDYLAILYTNCDFNREFPRSIMDGLGPDPRASCLGLAKDIEAVGRIVQRVDTLVPCETQTAMPVNRCQANLKLCRENLLKLKGLIETCRYKIKIDTATALKYKTN